MTMLDTAGNIKPLGERLRQAAQEGREIIQPWDHDPNLFDEAAAYIERLRAALKPFADAVYNDNGDMTITPCSIDAYTKAYFAMRDLR